MAAPGDETTPGGTILGLVFGGRLGLPIVTQRAAASFSPASVERKMIRHGSFTRSCASFLLAHGASIYDVKEKHGHSQIALTANTYAHLLDEPREATATRAGATMRAAFAASKRTVPT